MARSSAACRFAWAILATATLSLPLPARADMNAALKALVEAANKEGSVTLSWSTATFGGTTGAELFQAEMAKLWGSTIHVDFVPGADMARIGNQIATEFQAGQKAHVDIFLGAAPQVTPLLKLDMFQHVAFATYLPERIRPEFAEADNRILRVVTGLSGVTYNEQLAPMKPTRLEDFLRPEWKGRIASTPYAASLDVLLADDLWGAERTLNFARALSKQISGLIRCGETERVATGEYLALVMDCTGQDAILWQAKGAPVAQLLPLDAGEERYYYFAIPKNAQHPAAAALLSVFLLTEPGQKIAWDTWAIDLHSLPHSHTGAQIAAYEKAGGKLKEVTYEWWVQHPEIERERQQIIKLLSTRD
jgi:ABC-type Fe3+ transport system substrate-binding protein